MFAGEAEGDGGEAQGEGAGEGCSEQAAGRPTPGGGGRLGTTLPTMHLSLLDLPARVVLVCGLMLGVILDFIFHMVETKVKVTPPWKLPDIYICICIFLYISDLYFCQLKTIHSYVKYSLDNLVQHS